MRRLASTLASFAAALALAACVGGSTDTSNEDKERLKPFVLDKAPDEIPLKLNINFDGRLTLIGAKVTPEGVARSGTQVKVTMYWRADKKLENGWNLFTHILDGSGERVLNIDNVGPLREWKGDKQVMAPSVWEPGKVYVDEQDFTVPNNLRTEKIQFTTGVWRENDRLKILSGPADRENRAIVANIATGAPTAAPTPAGPEPSTRVPALRVDKLEKGVKLTLDGKLDEPAWTEAAWTGPFVDVRNGRPAVGFPVSGSVKLLWDEQHLYLGFDVKDPDIVSGFDKKQKDPHLWTKDTVEIMVDPDGDGDNKDYYEIQVNPDGLVFDSQFDEYNSPKKDPDGPFGHQEWEVKAKSGIVVNGTLDKPGDKDEGYVVELAIPWKSFGKAKATPPKVGDIWRINFYAMQENNGVAWSPILNQGNFHKASRFGRVMFAEKGYVPPVPLLGAGTAPPPMLAPPPGPAPSGGVRGATMPRLRLAPGIGRSAPVVPPAPQQPPP